MLALFFTKNGPAIKDVPCIDCHLPPRYHMPVLVDKLPPVTKQSFTALRWRERVFRLKTYALAEGIGYEWQAWCEPGLYFDDENQLVWRYMRVYVEE